MKKAELVGLIVDDMIRRRKENGTVSFPVDVDIQLDTLLQAEPEAEAWSDDEE